MQSWVDTHVWRTSIRLGLIGKKMTADNAHTLLQALLPQDARTIYNFHKGLLRHGQRICVFDRVLECAAAVLRGKRSKIEEVFCEFACYTSEEVLLDARSQPEPP